MRQLKKKILTNKPKGLSPKKVSDLKPLTTSTPPETSFQDRESISAVITSDNILEVGLNCRGEIVLFNSACERLTGYTFDEVQGKTVWDLFLLPEEIGPVKEVFGNLAAGNYPSKYENYWLNKNGERRMIAWTNTVQLNPQKQVEYVIATGIDVTEHKQLRDALDATQQKLIENEYFLANIFANIKDGISVLDTDLNIVQVNPIMEKWYAHALPLVGKKCYVAYHGRATPCEVCPSRRTLKTGKSAYDTVPKIGTGGQVEGWLNLHSFPFIDTTTGKLKGVIECVYDITERKQAEDALQQSEARYRTMIEHANDMIWAVDAEGRFIFGNRRIEEVTGHKTADWVGKSYAPLIYPDDLAVVADIHHKVLSGQSHQYTLRIYNKDGVIITLSISVAPLYEKDKVVGTVNFGRDITARKLMEDALHQSEKRYRTLAEAANDMIFIIDHNWCVQYVNSCGAEKLGMQAPDIIGKTLEALFHPPITERMEKSLQEVFDTGKPIYSRNQTPFRGQSSWLGTWLSPIKDKNKNVTAVMGISRDITEHKQMEDTLRESELKHRTLIESIQDGVFIIQDAKLIFANEAFARMFGYTVDELIGMGFQSLVAPEDLDMVTKRYFKRQAGETVPKEYEFRILHKNGSRIAVNMNVGISTYKDKIASMGTVKDITERKQSEEQLKDSLERLRKSFENTVSALASTAEARDPYTAGHQRRVAELAVAIASEMSLPKAQISAIRVAAVIHDLGKIAIPSQILTKPTTLTDAEFSLLKTHPQVAYDVLKSIEFPWPIAQIVLQHHEKINGTGYPQGLSGDQILLEAKIICAADSVEVMCTHRPYSPAMGINEALADIAKFSGTLYDSNVVNACVKLFTEKNFKWS